MRREDGGMEGKGMKERRKEDEGSRERREEYEARERREKRETRKGGREGREGRGRREGGRERRKEDASFVPSTNPQNWVPEGMASSREV